jgi:hypothetical protein
MGSIRAPNPSGRSAPADVGHAQVLIAFDEAAQDPKLSGRGLDDALMERGLRRGEGRAGVHR